MQPRKFIKAITPVPVLNFIRQVRYRSVVKIDASHTRLIGALVEAAKPQSLLEIGFGAGESTKAILDALDSNNGPFRYTLVDNWCDWQGERPAASRTRRFRDVQFVVSDEQDFVFACNDKFDFILSDADHHHAHEWFHRVYDDLLQPGGILIYHDVTNPLFEQLGTILDTVRSAQYRHVLFNRNSKPGEQCDRGLLVIFKD